MPAESSPFTSPRGRLHCLQLAPLKGPVPPISDQSKFNKNSKQRRLSASKPRAYAEQLGGEGGSRANGMIIQKGSFSAAQPETDPRGRAETAQSWRQCAEELHRPHLFGNVTLFILKLFLAVNRRSATNDAAGNGHTGSSPRGARSLSSRLDISLPGLYKFEFRA